MGDTSTKVSIPIFHVFHTKALSTFLKESKFQFLINIHCSHVNLLIHRQAFLKASELVSAKRSGKTP